MLASLMLAITLLAAPPASPPADSWLVTNVTVIPLDTGEALKERAVLIRNGRIEAIFPARKRRIRGATVIDGSGKFLMPGFVDAHVHMATEGGLRASKEPAPAALRLDGRHDRRILLSFLKAGVTGAANLGGSVAGDEALLQLRDAIAAGGLPGPRLFVGKRINGPRAAVASVPDAAALPPSSPDAPRTAADGAAAVRAAQARGYDFIKPYQFLDRDTYRAVIDTARELGLPTTGHLPELGCETCADRAFVFAHPPTNIAHAEELVRYARASDFAPADIDALAEAVAASRVSVTPTLVTLNSIVHMYRERELPPMPRDWLPLVDPVTRRDWHPPRNRYLGEAFRTQPDADTFPIGRDYARLLTRALWKHGVALTTGTDAAMPRLYYGVSLQQEMRELRAVGLPPIDVLRAASVHAHRLFARSESGAVREGAIADLVLLDADPLADIDNIARVAGVFVHGRWRSIADIDAELTGLRANDAALEASLGGADPGH